AIVTLAILPDAGLMLIAPLTPVVLILVMTLSDTTSLDVPDGANSTALKSPLILLILILSSTSVPTPKKLIKAPLPLAPSASRLKPLRTTTSVGLGRLIPMSELPDGASQLIVTEKLIETTPAKLPKSAQLISPPAIVFASAPL